MVIDQFVYDPSSGTGKLAASLTRGVFRYVGGRLSKHDDAVTLQTPSATIGIRGGVVLVDLPPGGGLDVIFAYGRAVTVTGANGVAQTLTRPGFEVTVSGPGTVPSRPAPAPQGQTGALLAQLDGRPGNTGGARTVPTDSTVAKSGISARVSGDFAASVQAADEAQPSASVPTDVNSVVRQNLWNFQITANQGIAASAPPSPPQSSPPVSPPPQSSPPASPPPQSSPPASPPPQSSPPASPPPQSSPPASPPPPSPPHHEHRLPPVHVVISYVGRHEETIGRGAKRNPMGSGRPGMFYSGGPVNFPPVPPHSGVFATMTGPDRLSRSSRFAPRFAEPPVRGVRPTSPPGPL